MAERESMAAPGDDDDFTAIEELLRSLSPDDLERDDLGRDDLERIEPPAHVWAGIEAALAAETPIPLDSRRPRRAPWLAAAAAILVLVGGVVALSRRGSEADVLASADLAFDAERFDPLGAEASARVSLLDDQGRLRITFDDARLPAELAEDADLELWLIEPDSQGQVSDLRSLGLVDLDDLGSFPIPDDIDPDRFRVVDISVEPRDGDVTHSGRSILRGALEAR